MKISSNWKKNLTTASKYSLILKCDKTLKIMPGNGWIFIPVKPGNRWIIEKHKQKKSRLGKIQKTIENIFKIGKVEK